MEVTSMHVETIRMSSKGQIVIPQDVREEVQAGEGSVFAVVGSRDTIILKKIMTPSKEELIQRLRAFAIKGRERAEELGITESDIPDLVQRARKSRR